jgi:hypothetical protein
MKRRRRRCLLLLAGHKNARVAARWLKRSEVGSGRAKRSARGAFVGVCFSIKSVFTLVQSEPAMASTRGERRDTTSEKSCQNTTKNIFNPKYANKNEENSLQLVKFLLSK